MLMFLWKWKIPAQAWDLETKNLVRLESTEKYIKVKKNENLRIKIIRTVKVYIIHKPQMPTVQR